MHIGVIKHSALIHEHVVLYVASGVFVFPIGPPKRTSKDTFIYGLRTDTYAVKVVRIMLVVALVRHDALRLMHMNR